MRPATVAERRRLYLLSRVVIARHYRRRLTLEAVAAALASSPRQLQRAYGLTHIVVGLSKLRIPLATGAAITAS